MMQQQAEHHDRLHELLAGRALAPLNTEETAELESLSSERDSVDLETYDRVAALIDPVLGETWQPMPTKLRARIERDAVTWLADSCGVRLAGEQAKPDHSMRPATQTRSLLSFIPWLIAAACVAILVFSQVPNRTPSPADAYRSIASSSTATRLEWASTEGADVSGDVVWDNDAQSGVLRLRGLAANDPSKLQYQLWIFDESRREQGHPAVDGGVFDIEQADGETYIRIDPKLSIGDPYLFAITTEPPGGVVEHVDEGDYRIVLTAAVPARET